MLVQIIKIVCFIIENGELYSIKKKRFECMTLFSESHDHFAHVLAVHHAHESSRPLVDSVEKGFMDDHFALFHPRGHVGEEALAFQVRSCQEAFNPLARVNHAGNVEMIRRASTESIPCAVVTRDGA